MPTPLSINISFASTSSFVPATPSQRQYSLNNTNPKYIRNAQMTQDCIAVSYYTASVIIPMSSIYQAAATALSALTWKPIIGLQPTTSIVTHPTASTFLVSSSVEFGTASYQWFSSSFSQSYTSPSSSYNPSFFPLTASGKFVSPTSASLTLTSSATGDTSSSFYCKVSGPGGTTTSSVAFLYVN